MEIRRPLNLKTSFNQQAQEDMVTNAYRLLSNNVSARASLESFRLMITGPTGRMNWLVLTIGCRTISRSPPSHLNSFALSIGFLASLLTDGRGMPAARSRPPYHSSTHVLPSINPWWVLPFRVTPGLRPTSSVAMRSTFPPLGTWFPGTVLSSAGIREKSKAPRLCKWCFRLALPPGQSGVFSTSRAIVALLPAWPPLNNVCCTLLALRQHRGALSRSFIVVGTFSLRQLPLPKGPSSATHPGPKFNTALWRPTTCYQKSLVLLTLTLPLSYSSPRMDLSLREESPRILSLLSGHTH